jgi:hypothetical protein
MASLAVPDDEAFFEELAERLVNQPLPPIPDPRIAAWSHNRCERCGGFIDVVWIPINPATANPDQARLCPDCFVLTQDRLEAFHRLFRHLRKVRDTLPLVALGATYATVYVDDGFRGDKRIFEFWLSAWARIGDDLASIADKAALPRVSPITVGLPSAVAVGTTTAESPCTIGYHLTLGFEVHDYSSRTLVWKRWNPVGGVQESTVRSFHSDDLVPTTEAALLRSGLGAVTERRGRSQTGTIEELTDFAMRYRASTGEEPTEKVAASQFDVDPRTIRNWVQAAGHNTWRLFLQSLPPRTRRRNTIQRSHTIKRRH